MNRLGARVKYWSFAMYVNLEFSCLYMPIFYCKCPDLRPLACGFYLEFGQDQELVVFGQKGIVLPLEFRCGAFRGARE